MVSAPPAVLSAGSLMAALITTAAAILPPPSQAAETPQSFATGKETAEKRANVRVCVRGVKSEKSRQGGGAREKIEWRITHLLCTSLPSREGVIIALERRTVDAKEEDEDEEGGGGAR